MVTHVVIFTWVADVAERKVEQFRAALEQLAHELVDFCEIHHGPDLHFRDGNGDYALIASFSDDADWAAYQAHPSHKTFVRDFVAPIQASRVAIQF